MSRFKTNVYTNMERANKSEERGGQLVVYILFIFSDFSNFYSVQGKHMADEEYECILGVVW